MMEKLFGHGRRGGVLLIAGAVLGAFIAGPGASIAQKVISLTTTTADKRYIKRGETLANGKTIETKIDKFTSPTFTPIATAKVNVPGPGWLYITGTVSAKDDSATAGDAKLQFRLAVDSTPLTTTPESFELFMPDGLPGRENGTVTGVVKTTAKKLQKVHLQAQEAAPGTGSTILGRSVSAIFVPKGKLPKTTTKKEPTGKEPTG
jgi:hypothetical protein